jgi:hypothetical protein
MSKQFPKKSGGGAAVPKLKTKTKDDWDNDAKEPKRGTHMALCLNEKILRIFIGAAC